MKNQGYFKGKKVLVVGLARSGYAAATLLSNLGAEVSVTDMDTSEHIKANAKKLKSKNIAIELGRHSEGFIKDNDLIVLSPGVNNKSEAVILANSYDIPIISEIELAWLICPAKIIAVTGTNGKTTVTALIGRVLQANNIPVHICGNIGNPFSVEVEKMKAEDYVSLEVSSFQLERIATFKPKISVILNFTPDHLDRYNNIKEYLEAKKRIFMNQDEEDYLVLNYADYTLRDLAKEARAKVIYFGTSEGLNPNHQAVMAVAVILGISQDTVNSVLNNFRGLEHRMEYVAELNGIEFINDSKATNIESTFWALKNINKPIILIAGGRDKGLKFETIRDIVRDKVKLLILIGEAKTKLKQAFKDVVDIKESDFLEEAVRLAFHNAKEGDCVLLSPMCASFDMFANFEERGNIFKKTVRELI